MKKRSILYVVIPCYNEELVLEETTKRLTNVVNELIGKKKISDKSKILYVDDGSKDETWELITQIHNDYKMFQGLKLSRNKGQQNAILAGLSYAKKKADIIITMDADLQDDISSMEKFINAYEEGNEVVYGVRGTRNTDSFLKKNTSLLFYKFMRFIGVDIIYNHCEYRLMSRRVVEALEEYKEVNLFLRGIIPLIGYKYTIVTYPRDKRFAGKTNYKFKQLFNLAIEAITSFTVKPLRLVSRIGMFILILSSLGLITLLILYLNAIMFNNNYLLILIIFFATGLNIISLGVVGEYVGKIYFETKKRPRYFIDEVLDD